MLGPCCPAFLFVSPSPCSSRSLAALAFPACGTRTPLLGYGGGLWGRAAAGGGAGGGASCHASGQACATDGDCCAGLTCPAGTCKPAQLCEPDGVACTLTTDCCALDCANGFCGGTQCTPLGSACGRRSPVLRRAALLRRLLRRHPVLARRRRLQRPQPLLQLLCNAEGFCGSTTCRPQGAVCVADADCCDMTCKGGVCGGSACQPDGFLCQSAQQCCSGACTAGVCGFDLLRPRRRGLRGRLRLLLDGLPGRRPARCPRARPTARAARSPATAARAPARTGSAA